MVLTVQRHGVTFSKDDDEHHWIVDVGPPTPTIPDPSPITETSVTFGV
jgi:hypothetical protein